MNEKNNRQFLRIITCALILIWFFGSALLMYYFSNKSGFKVIMIFGQCFFVFGILSFITSLQDMRKERENRIIYHIYNEIKDNRPISILLILFGAVIGVYGAFREWGSANFNKFMNQYGDPIYLGLFIIIAFAIILFLIYKLKKFKKIFSVEVSAEVIDVIERCIRSPFRPDIFVYAPVVKYSYNDKEYALESKIYSRNNVPQINDNITIYINPKAPHKFILPSDINIELYVSLVIVLSIMIICSYIGIYNFFF